ncbi:MAG TPA: cysteine desulfurase-like protein [Jatrophihabitantaceae bacterium]|jgi:cysteine desulfurase family protein (TIGR01976 family)|nr:cysteine desulfurase-like protein [Jatrophihabitantaceae bacterium]
MAFDVARVRGLYPTLGSGTAHLDGPFSALQPETVVRAIITTLRASSAQPGSTSASSARAATSVEAARRAIADLLGGSPDAVVLGGNLSTLLSRFASLLSRDWQLGDEIVLNRLSWDANIRPWLAPARSAGLIVRWAEADLETGALPDWQYDRLIGRRTRIVTVPLANPTTGAVPDIRAIADRAHEVGALVIVDAAAALPHLPVDIAELGADLIGVSARTFGGPTVGAVIARAGLLYELDSDVPGTVPQKFELGGLPVELLDGLTAAVDHIALLDEAAFGSRRERLLASIGAVAVHEQRLFTRLESGLRALPGVTVLGTSAERVPVLAFTVHGYHPEKVGDYLAQHGVSVWTGPDGMSELMHTIGVDELGGAIHVGLMPHTTRAEVERLISQLKALLAR